MNFPWYMARRLYGRGGDSGRISHSSTGIATAGVAVGLAVIIVSISVVLGFKAGVRDKVVGMGGHIQILNREAVYNPDGSPIQLKDSLLQAVRSISGVMGVQPFCQKVGMLKTDDAFQGVAFKGVDESFDLMFLRSAVVEGEISAPFSSENSTGRLVVSSYIANQLGLKVGSRVYAYFFDGGLRARRFTVVAVYATNLSEHDRNLVFCDYRTTHQLLGYADDQASGAEVLLNNIDSLGAVDRDVIALTARTQDDYGAYYASPTIAELFPGIFSWLNLLDLNVVVILILMLAVASFATVSGMLILILERTQFIGVMKALGATNSSLRRMFVYYSLLVVMRGILVGDAVGIAMCMVQKHWGIIRLDPTTYYVSSVPILMDWPLVVAVSLGVLLVSVLVLVIPSYIVSNIQPARSIRYE